MIYHFTDSARLPWILHDGHLNPGRCRLGGFPDPDFLWATTSPRGDRTASGGIGGYREGVTRLVRITLPLDDFTPWRQAANNHPEWTVDHIYSAGGLTRPLTYQRTTTRQPASAPTEAGKFYQLALETMGATSYAEAIYRTVKDVR
jgi:hypothetical protein